MAAGFLSPPGTEFGPCIDDCQHTDCAESRKIAASVCPICGEEIGYNRRFFREAGIGHTHEVCEIEMTERAFGESDFELCQLIADLSNEADHHRSLIHDAANELEDRYNCQKELQE